MMATQEATTARPALSPVPASPGAPYFTFTGGLMAFYAARGMWADGHPRGALAAMLGPQAPFRAGYAGRDPVFFVTAEQIGMLMRDLFDNESRGLSRRQLAQSLRRLRESLTRAGTRLPGVTSGATSPAAPTACLRPVPFEPLVRPVSGKAKAAFEKHVMDCVRAVVDFSQESVYLQADESRSTDKGESA